MDVTSTEQMAQCMQRLIIMARSVNISLGFIKLALLEKMQATNYMNRLSRDKLRTRLSGRMKQLVKNKPSESQQLTLIH